ARLTRARSGGAVDARRAVHAAELDSVVADLEIPGGGGSSQLHPALVQYPISASAVGSPGIGAGVRDDLYTILAAYDQKALSWATIRMRVIPLVSWLWVGGAVVGVGSVIAALPAPRRRIAREIALAEAPAPAK